jgi:hypothetical protein
MGAQTAWGLCVSACDVAERRQHFVCATRLHRLEGWEYPKIPIVRKTCQSKEWRQACRSKQNSPARDRSRFLARCGAFSELALGTRLLFESDAECRRTSPWINIESSNRLEVGTSTDVVPGQAWSLTPGVRSMTSVEC